MLSRTKTILAGAFFSILLLIGAVVAVLVAFRQNTQNPVAPTVPQVIPHAEGPATPSATPACILTFTVAAPQRVVCDNLTADYTSGTTPFTANFTLTGHTTGGGSIVNYKFYFGDGTTPLGQSTGTIAHTFSSDGAFTVKGTVSDNLGNTAGGSGNCILTMNIGHVVYKYKKCETGVNGGVACKEEDCVPNTTPCSGLSTCNQDSDCQPKFQHKVCLGNSCSFVDCSPPTIQCADSCVSDASCFSSPPLIATPPPTVVQSHRECRNRACVVVTGAGKDTCTSDVSCQPAATPPPIPRSGNTAATIGAIVLGVGVVVVGLLILL